MDKETIRLPGERLVSRIGIASPCQPASQAYDAGAALILHVVFGVPLSAFVFAVIVSVNLPPDMQFIPFKWD